MHSTCFILFIIFFSRLACKLVLAMHLKRINMDSNVVDKIFYIFTGTPKLK